MVKNSGNRTPGWVWAIILVLASTEPLLHIWIAWFPPEGAAPTGLRTSETVFRYRELRAFDSDYASRYIARRSPSESLPLFPTQVAFGVFGAVGRALGFSDFALLGALSGLCGALYLWAVYRFLRELTPGQANLAFVLFTLGGGLGGVLFLGTGMLGLHSAGRFEALFAPFAHYELSQGKHLSPVLHLSLPHYAVAFALCYGSLTSLAKAMRTGRPGHLAASAGLLFLGSYCHMRFAPMAWAIAALFLMYRAEAPTAARVRAGALLAGAATAGALMGFLPLIFSPLSLRNHLAVVHAPMWLSPFVTAMFFHFFTATPRVRCVVPRLPGFGCVAACGAAGYLVAFAGLYIAYQVYYGNYLGWVDWRPPVLFSDWSLVGAGLGGAAGWAGIVRKRRSASSEERRPEQGWIVLWLLLFLAVAVSGLGKGWFLRFTPERAMIFLGLPICILSAQTLQEWRATRPGLSRAALSTMVLCGLCSVVVAALYFRGPLGWRGPFALRHAEVMSEADARCLERTEEGRVLAPCFGNPRFGDVIAVRSDRNPTFGVGTWAFSDVPYPEIKHQIDTFFQPKMADAYRRAFVVRWQLRYVYCPDTVPVEETVVEQLRSASWLRTVSREGGATLFEVTGHRPRTTRPDPPG